MDLNLNFNGLTRLKDWWKIVRDNFIEVKKSHDAINTSLSNERTARINGDNSLQNQLNTHKSDKATGSVYSHVNLSDSVSSTSGISSSTAATPSAVKQAYDTAAAAQSSIDSEINARKQADIDLQGQITNIVTQNSIGDLYGKEIITHKVEMDIDWAQTEINVGPQQVGKTPVTTIDLSNVFNDYLFVLDDVHIFNSAMPEAGWTNDFSLRIGEGERQFIRMYWDITARKIWLDVVQQELMDNIYENGVWIFELGQASASFDYAEDGSGTYTASIYCEFYANSMGHCYPEAEYDGVRSIAQLEGSSNFLDAVNANTKEIQALQNLPHVTVDSALSGTSANPVQNKVLTQSFINKETLSVELICALLSSQSDDIKNRVKKVLKDSIENASVFFTGDLFLDIESYSHSLPDGSYEYPDGKVIFVSGPVNEFDVVRDDKGNQWYVYNVEGTNNQIGQGNDCIIKFDKPVAGQETKCYILFEW